MRLAAPPSLRHWPFRLIAFTAVAVLALCANWLWPRHDAAGVFPSADALPLSSPPYHRTALELPHSHGRNELWASYRGNHAGDQAYVSFSYGVQSFHDWIGCFLVQGPQPVWSGTLRVSRPGVDIQMEATVLQQAGELRAVAHGECWNGRWRGSSWQNRWFALWRAPGHPVPLLNAYTVQTAGAADPTQAGRLRRNLQAFLNGLDWNRLNAVCRTSANSPRSR